MIAILITHGSCLGRLRVHRSWWQAHTEVVWMSCHSTISEVHSRLLYTKRVDVSTEIFSILVWCGRTNGKIKSIKSISRIHWLADIDTRWTIVSRVSKIKNRCLGESRVSTTGLIFTNTSLRIIASYALFEPASSKMPADRCRFICGAHTRVYAHMNVHSKTKYRFVCGHAQEFVKYIVESFAYYLL